MLSNAAKPIDGPYEFSSGDSTQLRNDATVLTFTARRRGNIGTAGQESAFSGRLEDMPVADLAQTLESNRKSGQLEIEGDEARGSIYFEQGLVVAAKSEPLRGADAVYRLLSAASGRFSFYCGIQSLSEKEDASGLPAGVQGLLMEGMRQIDETQRLLAQIVDFEPDRVYERSILKDTQTHTWSEDARAILSVVPLDLTWRDLQKMVPQSDLCLAVAWSELILGKALTTTGESRI